MESINQRFKYNCVYPQINKNNYKIPIELYMPPQLRLGKSDIFLQQESKKIRKRKRYYQCSNVGAKREKPQVKHLLLQHKVINHKIQE